MPSSCSVIGCNSRGNSPIRKYFKFPMLNNSSSKTLAITQARQQAWLIALNRADFFANKYKSARVCDLHFISGRAAHYTDVKSPDWVPSKKLGYKIAKLKSNENSTEMDPICITKVEQCDTTYEFYDPVYDIASKETQAEEIRTTSIGTQTDGIITGCSNEIIMSYKDQIKLLEEMLSTQEVKLDSLRDSAQIIGFINA